MTDKKPPKKRAATPAKRTTPKPATGTARKRVPAPRALVDAPSDRCFWINFGPVLKNLRELRDAFADGISDAQFRHHVGPGKNDFANWVEAVLADTACATALRRAKTRSAALRAVEASLKRYA